VRAKYTLFKAVVGFCRRDLAIIILPIGTEVRVMHPLRSSILDVLWEGRHVAVFGHDLKANGTLAEDPAIG